MKLIATNEVKSKFYDTFTVKITTMEGDADDWHYLEYEITDEELPVLQAALKYIQENRHADKLIREPVVQAYFGEDPDWHHYEGIPDLYESHEFFYYDEEGRQFHAEVK